LYKTAGEKTFAARLQFFYLKFYFLAGEFKEFLMNLEKVKEA